jgi:hypothetical protein
MRRIATAALLTGTLTATVLLAGCQIEPQAPDPGLRSKPSVSVAAKPARLADHTPAEILRRAEAAMRSAGTVQVVGSDGELALNRRGAKGWLRDGGKGPKAQVISLDGRLYLRGRAYWAAQEHGREVAAVVGDRWVDVSANAPKGQLDEAMKVLSFGGFVDTFHKEIVRKEHFTTVQELTVAGVQVVRLRNAKGVSLDVAASGPAYPLRYDAKGTADDMRMSAFGRPVTITRPADPIDPAKPYGRTS